MSRVGKILIRETMDSDIPAFLGILDEYDAGLFWPDHLRPPRDRGQAIAWWHGFVLDSLTAIDQGEIVGCGFLDVIRPGHSVSINIFKRKGYRNPRAVAAICSKALPLYFEKYRTEKMVGYIAIQHKSCVAFARRCGFRMDGISRRHTKINGKWVDYAIMSILKEEAWKQSRRFWVKWLA